MDLGAVALSLNDTVADTLTKSLPASSFICLSAIFSSESRRSASIFSSVGYKINLLRINVTKYLSSFSSYGSNAVALIIFSNGGHGQSESLNPDLLQASSMSLSFFFKNSVLGAPMAMVDTAIN